MKSKINMMASAMFAVALAALTGCASSPSADVPVRNDGMRAAVVKNNTTLSLYVEVEGWRGFQEVKPLSQTVIASGSGENVVIRAKAKRGIRREGCTGVPNIVDFGQCQKKISGKNRMIVVDWNDFPSAKP